MAPATETNKSQKEEAEAEAALIRIKGSPGADLIKLLIRSRVTE